MRDESLLRSCLHGLLAVLCTIAIALALGAVWMAITLRVPSAYWWFALPAGLGMGYATRAWVTKRRAWGVLLAIAGMLLAAIYMKCLFVSLQLAAFFGLGLIQTMETAGAGMLLALARNQFDMHILGATLAGMVLAGWVAWYQGKRRKSAALKHPAP